MIAKIKIGMQFPGVVKYGNNTLIKLANIIASKGVNTSSNQTISASFLAQAKTNRRIKNCVGHIVLGFSPKDTSKLTDDLIAQISCEYMRKMGIANTQFVMFRHHDQPHEHVHIVYNRINDLGKAITGDTNFRKSASITKAITREYGLTFGKGKKDVRREKLLGKDADKYKFYDTISLALKTCHNWDMLKKHLIKEGINIEFHLGPNGKAKGVLFSNDTITFAGGKIDRSLTFGNINRTFLTNNQVQSINGTPIRASPAYSHKGTTEENSAINEENPTQDVSINSPIIADLLPLPTATFTGSSPLSKKKKEHKYKLKR